MSSLPSDSNSHDIRPVVRTAAPGNFGLYAFAVVLLGGGFWLFSALSASREAASGLPVTAVGGTAPAISSPPPLRLPQDAYGGLAIVAPAPDLRQPPVLLQRMPAPSGSGEAQAPFSRPVTLPEPMFPQPVAELPGPRVLYDQFRPQAPAAPAEAAAAPSGQGRDRVEAGRLANPDMTVPQGTVIPAVLETAFDSTRPGGARALVQRDIAGFDGSRVLIPRGSRLYGSYDADLVQGERRAMIQWTRLVRPDGVTIALDSPASDPLGRAGVTGDIDSRFLARFGGAILQSVLDIGVGVATREVGSGVIVALPGSTQNVAAAAGQTQQIQPVLRVEHGTSVSVFVARDLDFSSVDR